MINHFEIKRLKTMEGMDGYVTACDLYYKNKKIGEYFNNGDGSQYTFTPGDTCSKLEKFLEQFPKIKGFSVNWNIGILIDELINQKEDKRQIRKAQKKGITYILVDVIQGGETPTKLVMFANGLNPQPDVIEKAVKAEIKKKQYYTYVGMQMYHDENEIDVDYGLELTL